MPEQTTHPSPEELVAYSLGQLSRDEAAIIESHISECQPCCETIVGLSSDDTFVALLQEARQLPPDQMVDQQDQSTKSSASLLDVPGPLAEHPRYEIISLIGKGGMGDVYKAKHRMMERAVALKIINRELVRESDAVDRFHREVKTAARLSHPNIVTAYDAEQAGDVHFLVMEYVFGVDLAHTVKNHGALSIAEACDYVRQAAIGLQYAHEMGMVHRDIKPHNLMVTADGTVKILDFGLASLAPEALSDADTVQARSDLTAAGSIMGTPDFISPEQAGDPHAADIRSDIYSLGCTLYYLLTGRPPFAEGSATERVKAHGDVEPQPIENVRSDISSELADTVQRMMAKQPSDRFQTPAEAADALAPFADGCSDARWAHGRISSRMRPAASRWWWPPTIAQSLILAVFAVLLAGIYVTTDSGTLSIISDDDNIEIIIYDATRESTEATDSAVQMRIVDTLTGSSVKRLRSGEYVIEMKEGSNEFELNKRRFVINRGSHEVVRISKKAPLAETVHAMREGQTVSYTTTIYTRVYSKDGERTWLDTHKFTTAYRHPGLYRNTSYDNEGNVSWVYVVDSRSGKSLSLNMKRNEVHRGGRVAFQMQYDPKGPLGWIADAVRSEPVELAGQRNINGRRVTVVRYRRETMPNDERNSLDIWIDAENKELVAISDPGADVFDPSAMIDRGNPPEKAISKGQLLGSILSDIVLDAGLDADLFNLTPPKGFTVVEHAPRQSVAVTEAELVEWLGLTAQVNNDVFMESEQYQRSEHVRAALQKEPSNRNDVEVKLGNLWRTHMMNDNPTPVVDFCRDNTIPGSFRYVGKGVELGASERIVCWYKLKDTGKYRAIFGDLTVREVEPTKLPLPVD